MNIAGKYNYKSVYTRQNNKQVSFKSQYPEKSYYDPQNVVQSLNTSKEQNHPKHGLDGGVKIALGSIGAVVGGLIAGPPGVLIGGGITHVTEDVLENTLAKVNAANDMRETLSRLNTSEIVQLADHIGNGEGMITLDPLAARVVGNYCRQECSKVNKALKSPIEVANLSDAQLLIDRRNAIEELSDKVRVPASFSRQQYRQMNELLPERYVDTIKL